LRNDLFSLMKEAATMKSLLTCSILSITILFLTAGAAGAEEIIVPESWAGVWETTTIEKDCQTLEIVNETTSRDTLCAGDVMNPEDPDGLFICSGSISDGALHMECSVTTEVFPGCSLSISLVSDATRTGDTSTGVSINSFTYTGVECFFEDTCTRLESTSVRTGEDPGCGTSPIAAASWGSLKSVYR